MWAPLSFGVAEHGGDRLRGASDRQLRIDEVVEEQAVERGREQQCRCLEIEGGVDLARITALLQPLEDLRSEAARRVAAPRSELGVASPFHHRFGENRRTRRPPVLDDPIEDRRDPLPHRSTRGERVDRGAELAEQGMLRRLDDQRGHRPVVVVHQRGIHPRQVRDRSSPDTVDADLGHQRDGGVQDPRTSGTPAIAGRVRGGRFGHLLKAYHQSRSDGRDLVGRRDSIAVVPHDRPRANAGPPVGEFPVTPVPPRDFRT